MILVTGATGCIGKAVVERLVSSGHQVKCLFQWGNEHPAPRRVVITGGDVRNEQSIYEAITDGGACDTVIHLAGLRRETRQASFDDVNIKGTGNVIAAMKRADIKRFITVGCIGAEVRSPFPLQRALGKAEEIVRQSGINFTVLKSAVVYGEKDWLTNWMSGVATSFPFVMPVPHSGQTKLQPIWVGDVAACVERCLNTRSTFRQVVPIGGPQALTLADIAQITMTATHKQRRLVRVPSALTKQIAAFLARCRGALNEIELEALSYNRTTEIGGVHRVFGFAPAKMPTKLAHLGPQEPPPLPVRFRPRSPRETRFMGTSSNSRALQLFGRR
jgi:NADH dehydrogenase